MSVFRVCRSFGDDERFRQLECVCVFQLLVEVRFVSCDHVVVDLLVMRLWNVSHCHCQVLAKSLSIFGETKYLVFLP